MHSPSNSRRRRWASQNVHVCAVAHGHFPLYQAEHSSANQKLQEELAALKRFDSEIKELEDVIKAKEQIVSDADLQLKKLDHDIQNIVKDKQAQTGFVVAVEKQNPWIAEEKKSFGKPGGAYDFEALNMAQSKEKARELEDMQKSMKKKVNPKALNMLEGYGLFS